MAATATNGVFFPTTLQAASASNVRTHRRRRIDTRAGHALEILGHAIEYLTDELVHEGTSLSGSNRQFEAVQLLMSLNRQIYFECPEVPSVGERWRSLLGFHSA